MKRRVDVTGAFCVLMVLIGFVVNANAVAQVFPSPKRAHTKSSSQPQAPKDDWWGVVCWLTPFIDWSFCPGHVDDPPVKPKTLQPDAPQGCDIYGPCQSQR